MRKLKIAKEIQKEMNMWDEASCEDYMRFEYALMARDRPREKEALAWCEGLIGDSYVPYEK